MLQSMVPHPRNYEEHKLDGGGVVKKREVMLEGVGADLGGVRESSVDVTHTLHLPPETGIAGTLSHSLL